MLEFQHLVAAWRKLYTEREADLRERAPNLANPKAIFLKKLAEDAEYLTIEFMGFDNAVENAEYIPQVKGAIQDWLKKIRMNTQIMRSPPDVLIVRISKELKIGESRKINTSNMVKEQIDTPPSPGRKYVQAVPDRLTHIMTVRYRGTSNGSEKKS